MKLFNKVAIVGVGLIGGSIGLAIKKRKLANIVVGVSRHKKTLFLAKKRGAIDIGEQGLRHIKDADLVILATPVSTILRLSSIISKIIKPDCIVTDVGSTKLEITKRLIKIFPRFVGSHPLVGSEKQGVINASPQIFKNSLCLLTPAKNTHRDALAKIKKLWMRLGAKTVFLNPSEHDRILSFVSHLPHILAFSLMDIIPEKYLRFASSGLKDTTRIAASDAHLWVDIFLSNQRNVLRQIGLFQKNLSLIKKAISKKDKILLIKILKEARQKRDSLNR